MTRRTFLCSAAASAAATAVGHSSAAERSGAANAAGGPRTSASMEAAQSSSPAIYAATEHASGIPLGGLGTGSVEIRPDERLAVSPRRFELRCASGEMTLKALRLAPASSPWKPKVNGKPVAAKVREEEGLAVIAFAEPLRFAAGDAVTATA